MPIAKRGLIATIGVYGFTAETFCETLGAAGVTLLIDVRQRRGVRGPEYAWANSLRLQALLKGVRIAYRHHRELAPSTELRQLQYREDDRQGVGKRNRHALAPEYIRRYTEEILNHADLEALIEEFPPTPEDGIAAFLCVESIAGACHRSLIATRIAREHGFTVLGLEP